MRWRAGFLLILCALGGCSGERPAAADTDDFGQLPDFTLTERSGRTIRRDDLRGKVWVASFTFTRCAGICGQISETMQKLQAEFGKEKDFLLVSISVDPEHDTSEIQQRYAEEKGADADRWLFLTGRQDEIYRLIGEGFRLKVRQVHGPERKPGFEVDHTPKVALVDQRGHVRGYFDGRQRDDVGEPVDDLPKLKRQIQGLLRAETARDLATINAALNATGVVLLLAGWWAIRRRKENAHKTCMLAALAVSAIFLASYLYLHIIVKQGQSTRFADQQPEAPYGLAQLYYATLVSHIILAAVVTPLAVYLAYLGLRDRRPRHVRLARWTLPIWLYVSTTGVVVYWMLYRM